MSKDPDGLPFQSMGDVEVISILKDSMSLINLGIPSLPKELQRLGGGAQLINGDLLISGGGPFSIWNDIPHGYFRYKDGSNQWKIVGTMKRERFGHSSVLIDDNLLTTGGYDLHCESSANHEEFSIKGE